MPGPIIQSTENKSAAADLNRLLISSAEHSAEISPDSRQHINSNLTASRKSVLKKVYRKDTNDFLDEQKYLEEK